MTDLVAFLRARLDEDEQAARRAAALCGCHPPAPAWSFRDGDEPTDGRILVVDEPHPERKRKLGRRWNGTYDGLFMARHIARWDPARALAEVDAKRRIVRLHEPVILRGGSGAKYFETTTVCRSCEPPQFPEHAVPCPTLRLLALPYAAHPDYRPEWAPAA